MKKFPAFRKNNLWKVYIFFSVFLVVSCRTIPMALPSEETDFPKFLFKSVSKYPAQYFSCDQINIKYDDGSVKSANLSVNIKRSEFIYANANIFGIEIGRLLITPDSIKIINRFEKTYFFGSINELKDKFGTDLSYFNLETLLLKGVAVDAGLTQKLVRSNVVEKDSVFIFKSKQTRDFSFASEYNKDNFLLKGMALSSGNTASDLNIKLTVTDTRNELPKSLFITIQKSDYKATVTAEIGSINYSKFEQKSFTINSKYSEMQF